MQGTNLIPYQSDLSKIKENNLLPHVSESKSLDPLKINIIDIDSEKVKKDFIIYGVKEDLAHSGPVELAEKTEKIE